MPQNLLMGLNKTKWFLMMIVKILDKNQVPNNMKHVVPDVDN